MDAILVYCGPLLYICLSRRLQHDKEAKGLIKPRQVEVAIEHRGVTHYEASNLLVCETTVNMGAGRVTEIKVNQHGPTRRKVSL